MAPGMTSNVLTQWKAYQKFCSKYDLHEWPASKNTLCLFAQYLAKRMRSVQSIDSYLRGVCKLHRYAGEKPPDMVCFEIQTTLKGLKRQLKHKVKQAKPLTPKILKDLYDNMNFKKDLH